jgi:hypothetical protein
MSTYGLFKYNKNTVEIISLNNLQVDRVRHIKK